MSEDMNILTSATTFMYTLLTGTTDRSNPSVRVKRLYRSFDQDIVYVITNDTVKSTKQTTVPFTVKSLAGKVELVHIHSTAWSQRVILSNRENEYGFVSPETVYLRWPACIGQGYTCQDLYYIGLGQY
jgi:hypothetical protein